jgi:hypothetical protein
VKEASSALEASPSSTKALRSRAKALEKQGLYKQALADIQVGCWGAGWLLRVGLCMGRHRLNALKLAVCGWRQERVC